jgi:hypothetical protein
MLRCHVAKICIAASVGFYDRFGALSLTASGRTHQIADQLASASNNRDKVIELAILMGALLLMIFIGAPLP